jgi:uncharacterized membrane protein
MTQLILKISTLWGVSASATTLRTAIFTVGHFFIDFYVISAVTGASVEQATIASLIAPAMNGVWYWILDRFWTQTHMYKEDLPRNSI